jgi:tetratricopeptide (TPR) repeat protein
MREWQVGDPICDGNDIGVPDVRYMDYLKNRDDAPVRKNNVKDSDIEKSRRYQDEAWKLNEENKFYDALTFIDAAINHNPNDEDNWNIQAIILLGIFRENDKDVAYGVYSCFNKALGLNPYNKTIKRNKAKFLTEWAVYLVVSDDLEQAMKRANEALSIFEDKTLYEYGIALDVKATIFRINEEYEEALKYFDKALEVLPDDEFIQKGRESVLEKMNGSL